MGNMEERQVEMWNHMEKRIAERFGKYRRKLWNDMENNEERQVE
jgi:hypothetical protein